MSNSSNVGANIEWEDPRRVLARHGAQPKKSFSQNFLVARGVVEKIAASVPAETGALVVELGPGVGTLTTALLRRGLRVHAIEKDPQMLGVLRVELGACDAFAVQDGDATTFDLIAFAQARKEPVHVVGNLPYAVTGAVFRNLCAQATHAASVTVMIQREVRDRLVAKPGGDDWGALSVHIQNHFDAAPLFTVPAGAFHPPPRVQSAVVALTPRQTPRVPSSESFDRTVRAIFDMRRKTIRNALRAIAQPEVVDASLRALDIDEKTRGETLDIETIGRLAQALYGASPQR